MKDRPSGKEANWVYTAPDKQWVSLSRFYGPEKAVFDKAWRLPDIEKLNEGTGGSALQ